MNVIAVACVRDEFDVIEAFVRHNLAYANRLIVLDNGSSDGTRDVLDALQGEGLPLDVLSDPSPGKQLSKRMTMLMRDHAVRRHGADWVLPLDADEFVTVAGDGPLVPEGASVDQPLRLTWLSYLPDVSDDPAEVNPVVRIRHRLMDEPEQRVIKVFVPGKLAGCAGAVLEPGNHEFSLAGRVCPSAPHDRACLAHFPVRSRGQFVAKTVIGNLQNLVMAFHDPRWGAHHRTYYDLLQRDPHAFSSDFASWLRTHHVYQFCRGRSAMPEPLAYRGGPLCYTPLSNEAAQSWKPILHYARDLARRYGLLKESLTEDQQVSLEQQVDVFAFLRQQLDLREQSIFQHGQPAQLQQHIHAAELRLQALERQHQQQLQAADLRAQALEQQRQEQVRQANGQLQTLTQQLQTAEAHLREAQQREAQQREAYLREAYLREAHLREAHLRMETQRLDRELRHSLTWRVGRLALWPARVLRRGWYQCRSAVASLR